MTPEEQLQQKVRLSAAFRPGTPIDKQQLFSGRMAQVNDVLNAALQPGRHVIMFGERGVGKTSLARVISEIIKTTSGYKLLNCGTINCDTTDDFNSLWRKIFRELYFVMDSQESGFKAQSPRDVSLESILPNRELTPDDVRYMLDQVEEHTLIIIDEFDRLSPRPRIQLADTIKNLSDHAINTTLMLIGVADAVDELIADHQSIDRALVQVPMQRMSQDELVAIVDYGLSTANMTVEPGVSEWIARLAQGLPYYAHALGLYSAFRAIEADRIYVLADDVIEATKTTVTKSHTLLNTYNLATSSPQKQNLFAGVLLGCALAQADELGYFTASAVTAPMSSIMGRLYPIPNFSKHLFELCEPKRGSVLKKFGTPRRFRFRFNDPMMQAFVIIHDYSLGTLTNDLLERSKARTRTKENKP